MVEYGAATSNPYIDKEKMIRYRRIQMQHIWRDTKVNDIKGCICKKYASDPDVKDIEGC